MAEARSSIRRRLLALLVAATATIWILVAGATFVDSVRETGALFDAQLVEYSEVLGAIAGHEVLEMGGETPHPEELYPRSFAYQVWSASGELLLRSHAAPDTPLGTVDGFSNADAHHQHWRVYRRTDPQSKLVIATAQDSEIREELGERMALHLLVPALIGLPLLGLAIWLAVARGMAPLARLAGEVARREAHQLDEVDARGAPSEVKPLVDALNQLFARVRASFEIERRFTGDAAHELRTPLAALRTQAEVALSTASDDKRRHALGQVIAGVERSTRLVEQLLAMARIDASVSHAGEAVDMGRVAREVIDEMGPRASAAGVTLSSDAQPPAPGAFAVEGDPVMLHALIGNLVDNAIRYTPQGSKVRVRVERRGERIAVDVEDSGRGVPEEVRERIFDRFFRITGTAVSGSGLGLSIARRVVELHGGSIVAGASAELGGLRVSVSLPARGPKEPLRSGLHRGGVTDGDAAAVHPTNPS